MTQPAVSNAFVVVDASALFTVIDAARPRGDAIVDAIGSRVIVVPSVAEYEVTNVIRRYQAAKTFSPEHADRLYRRFRRIPVRIVDFHVLAARMWELRAHVRTADAAYVAVAEMLGTDLLTTDARLASTSAIRCPVQAFARHEPGR